ncbi:MAG: hypothetical protein K0R63_383 [Rickettsiales bacterium]|nr:hypothetical protein [Rickettsiales bacterium]
MLLRITTALVMLLLSSACTKTIVDHKRLEQMNNKTVVHFGSGGTPRFNFEKFEDVATNTTLNVLASATSGALGGPALIPHKFVESYRYGIFNELPNPADQVSAGVAKQLAQKYQLKYKGNLESANDFDLLVDVKTIHWGMTSNITATYKIYYTAELTVRESTNRHTPIVKLRCSTTYPNKLDTGLTHNKLIANDGKLLKESLDMAADQCVEQLVEKISNN